MGNPEAVLRATVDRLEPAVRDAALAAIEQLVADRDRARDEAQELAYASSHDLNEPLRMVRSYLGLLERRLGDGLDERGKEFLFYAVDGAQRGQQLLDDLLRYSRVSTQTGEPAWVDLAPLAGDAAEGDLGRVWGDPAQVKALLDALLTNARTYGSTTVTVRREGDAVLVEDDGIGIAPKDHERIFRVFGRLHARETYPGTGIGLALARRIVERHGGRLWVDSDEGLGATFGFTLPEPAP